MQIKFSPIRYQKVSKMQAQTSPIKYKKELCKDTISFTAANNGAYSTCEAAEILVTMKASPNIAMRHLNSLSKEEFLDCVLNRGQEFEGTTLRLANKEQLKTFIEVAKEKGCLEDIIFFETDKIASLDYDNKCCGWPTAQKGKSYGTLKYLIPACLTEQKVQVIFDKADDSLKEQMLKTEEFTQDLRNTWSDGCENKYLTFPGIAHITESKNGSSKSFFDNYPDIAFDVLVKKLQQAQQALKSEDSNEADKARALIGELSSFAKKKLLEKSSFDEQLHSKETHLHRTLRGYEDGIRYENESKGRAKSFIGFIQPHDIKEIIKSGDLRNISSSYLCVSLYDRIEDENLRKQFLDKQTAFGIPVRKRIWQEKYKAEIIRLIKPEEKNGANSLIYSQDFETTMRDLRELFYGEHIPELKDFLLNMDAQQKAEKINIWDDWGDMTIGHRYEGTKYPLNKLFKEKIGDNKTKQQQFEAMLKEIITNERIAAHEASALLEKYQCCISPETLEGFSDFIYTQK